MVQLLYYLHIYVIFDMHYQQYDRLFCFLDSRLSLDIRYIYEKSAIKYDSNVF